MKVKDERKRRGSEAGGVATSSKRTKVKSEDLPEDDETQTTKRDNLNTHTITCAVKALLAFHKKKAESERKLPGADDERILIQITLQRIPGNSSPKPIQLSVPHPIHGDSDCQMCLFIKKEDKPLVKSLLMEDNPVEGLAKIITLDKLRTSYARFSQRRELLASYDLFLADERILPMLCKALGKTFFSRKKQPIPLCVTRHESLPHRVRRARDSTSLIIPSGTCVAVIVGNTNMTPKELVANIVAAASSAIEHIPRKWKNIQAIQVKTADSMSLPIFNKLPFGRIENDPAQADEPDASQKTDDSSSETKPAKKVRPAAEGSTVDTGTPKDIQKKKFATKSKKRK
eukprot:CAMPEP_0185767368 /NCGR_PEP_ID=MMETSP1174-20130828/42524_1 /TAXON_ID=35687 /ORGANISM="Dictyocha speculum, Strain CCMP1381" /LENGTH=343 /DNA_ID=CAMNT_0028451519 /DNA_START=32 /DNA_END=1063 /DNA_ORIENTATION=+